MFTRQWTVYHVTMCQTMDQWETHWFSSQRCISKCTWMSYKNVTMHAFLNVLLKLLPPKLLHGSVSMPSPLKFFMKFTWTGTLIQAVLNQTTSVPWSTIAIGEEKKPGSRSQAVFHLSMPKLHDRGDFFLYCIIFCVHNIDMNTLYFIIADTACLSQSLNERTAGSTVVSLDVNIKYMQQSTKFAFALFY